MITVTDDIDSLQVQLTGVVLYLQFYTFHILGANVVKLCQYNPDSKVHGAYMGTSRPQIGLM